MSIQPANGAAKAEMVGTIITAVVSTVGLIAAIATPLILMYSKLNAMDVQYSERLREIETQFKAADEFRNVNLAGQMRFNALLWQQSFGQPFPQEVYFPTIARPNQ